MTATTEFEARTAIYDALRVGYCVNQCSIEAGGIIWFLNSSVRVVEYGRDGLMVGGTRFTTEKPRVRMPMGRREISMIEYNWCIYGPSIFSFGRESCRS